MDAIRGYILSVTAAAVLCAMICAVGGEKGHGVTLRKVLCGVFLAITVVAPLSRIRLPDSGEISDFFFADGEAAVTSGRVQAQNELREGIKSRAEAYILDKAERLSLSLTVQVELTEDPMPVPCAVRLTGAASPYAKAALSAFLEEEFGIAKENQKWISTFP